MHFSFFACHKFIPPCFLSIWRPPAIWYLTWPYDHACANFMILRHGHRCPRVTFEVCSSNLIHVQNIVCAPRESDPVFPNEHMCLGVMCPVQVSWRKVWSVYIRMYKKEGICVSQSREKWLPQEPRTQCTALYLHKPRLTEKELSGAGFCAWHQRALIPALLPCSHKP